jgi:hypothetical protein
MKGLNMANKETTTTVASVKDILGIIDQINDTFAYGVWIPSLKREVLFKEITTSQQKKLIKSIIDSPVYNTQFIFALYQVIKENCAEKDVNLDELTILDKFFISFAMRSASIDDVWEMDFGKNNKRGFSLKKIIDDAKLVEFNIDNKVVEDGPYSAECGIPLISNEFNIERELRSSSNDETIEGLNIKKTGAARQMMGDIFVSELVKHIRKITIKRSDEESLNITFDNNMTAQNKIAIIEKLPAKLIGLILDYIEETKKEVDKILLFKTVFIDGGKEIPMEERLDLDGRFFTKS